MKCDVSFVERLDIRLMIGFFVRIVEIELVDEKGFY